MIEALERNVHLHRAAQTMRTNTKHAKSKRRTQMRIKARKRLKKMQVLHKMPVFSGLPNNIVNKMVDMMSLQTNVEPGTVIVSEGEKGRDLFVVMKGECEAFVGGLKVGRIKKFEHFGEHGLLGTEDTVRSATVVVSQGSCASFLVLTWRMFRRLVASGDLGSDVLAEIRWVEKQRKVKTADALKLRARASSWDNFVVATIFPTLL